MGLLKHLLFWPVTGPTELVRFSLRQVGRTAVQELTDEGQVTDELMQLQLLLDLGEIDEAAFEEREAALIARLREIRQWRERLGMEPTWAPYGKVSPPDEPEE